MLDAPRVMLDACRTKQTPGGRRETLFGPDSIFVAGSLDVLAKVCEQAGRSAEAQELSARAQRIRAQAASAGS